MQLAGTANDSAMTTRLSVDNLTVTLGGGNQTFTLKTGVWAVERGDVIALTGASGSGKTLLLEMLGLLRAPDSGGYIAQNDDTRMEFHRYWASANATAQSAAARATVFGFVPQTGGLLPYLSVAENVALTQKIANRVDDEWVAHLLATLGLGDVATLRPNHLSIGQRQRVAIARALAHRPFCVIADEPTASLDPDNAHRALGLLIDTAIESNSATIVSSHDYMTLAEFTMRRKTLSITSAPGASAVVSELTDVVTLEREPVA